MRAVLVNVYDEYAKEVEIKDELDEYYELLNCSTIDIVSRKIGRKWFDIVCDDEGLLKQNPKISAIDNLGSPMLVGNLIILHNDGEGGMAGLDQKDSKYVLDRIEKMSTLQYMDGYPMLTQCEYC